MAKSSTITRQTIPLKPEFEKILRNDEVFGTGVGNDIEDRLNNAFDLLLIRSGLEIAPSLFLLLSMCTGLTLGGLLFVLRENILTAALGFFAGGVLPLIWALVAQSNRRQKMLTQMPEMVDELARAARTGRSVEQCLMLVAHDTAAPLGSELKRCAGRLRPGHRHARGTGRSADPHGNRHNQNPGDGSDGPLFVRRRSHQRPRTALAHDWGRMLYLARLRASTAASRATAILMLVVPPLVLGFFMLRDPEYFSKLFAVKWGRIVTLIAAVLDVIGIVWVLRVLKSSQQT